MVNLENTVIFRPVGESLWQKLMYNYKALTLDHSGGNAFFRFEFKKNVVIIFDLEAPQHLYVLMEPLQCSFSFMQDTSKATITLPVLDGMPLEFIQGNGSSFAYTRYTHCNGSVSYSTNSITPEDLDGLNIRFEPFILHKGSSEQKFNIFDGQTKNHLGILFLQRKTTEITLTFVNSLSQTEKQKIIGLVACFISDVLRGQHFIHSWALGSFCAFFAFILIFVYLFPILNRKVEDP